MATTFIGKSISLLSHSDVRYRGTLAGIDPANSTIQLRNVYSMGTETRRPPEEFIPPAEQPYLYIIFRAQEVKDIALDNDQTPPAPRRTVHDDPAVVGVSAAPVANGGYGQIYPPAPSMTGITPPPQPIQQQVPPALGTRPAPGVVPTAVNPIGVDISQGRNSAAGRRSAAIANADASLESVERAMGEVRLASTNARTRRNGGNRHSATAHAEITVPITDFDFQGMNARFDKAALNPRAKNGTAEDDEDDETNPSEEEGEVSAGKSKSPKPKETETSYNPKSSFFDSLSSSASGLPPNAGRGVGRGRGRGMGKSRREEEREKNVATFGEPGGVGFLGPNAYVGGYGRRGRGGRRGGGPRRNVVVGTEA